MRHLGVAAVVGLMTLATTTAGAQTAGYVASWGGFGAGPGQFDIRGTCGIAVAEDGRVLATDGGNYRVQVFESNGQFLYEWGTHGESPGQFGGPSSLALNRAGEVFVTDRVSRPVGGRVQVFAGESTFVKQWSTDPTGLESLLNTPISLAVNSEGSVFVGDAAYSRIRKYSSDGNLLLQWGGNGALPGQMGAPTGIAVDDHGKVFVADPGNHRVQVFDEAGNFLMMWGQAGSNQTDGHGLFDSGPTGIAVDAGGYVYCTDAKSVQVFTSAGAFVDQWGGTRGSSPGQFNSPGAIAIGSDGLVYVLDTGNNRIQVFTRPATPTQSTSWGKLKATYR